MKSFISLIILLSVYQISSAQKVTYNLGAATTNNYYEEVPYQVNNGKLFVMVQIAGKPHKFLFDTGAPVMLDKALVADLNLPILRQDRIIDVSGKVDSSAIASLKEIKIGNIAFEGVPALVGIPDQFKCWQVDGVVGSNLLRNSIVSFDNEKHIIILTDQLDKLPFLNKKSSGTLATNTDVQSTPIMTFNLKGKVNMIIEFDSGDSGFLRLTEEMMNKITPYKVYDLIAKGYGADAYGAYGLQKPADKYQIKIPFLTIAGTRFDNVVTATNNTGIPGVGAQLLEYGRFTLDYMHGKYYFNAYKDKFDLNENLWAITPAVADDKMIVGVVWDSAKDQAKSGQQIVAIDDQPYPKVTFCDWLMLRPGLKKKTSAVFTIKDEQGNLKKITVSK
jgi:predicted aspartyl protease